MKTIDFVSAQYVNKLIKGNEKFGGEILIKLEEVLEMPIFVQNLPREKQELLKEEITVPVFSKKMTVVIPLFIAELPEENLDNTKSVYSETAVQKTQYANSYAYN